MIRKVNVAFKQLQPGARKQVSHLGLQHVLMARNSQYLSLYPGKRLFLYEFLIGPNQQTSGGDNKFVNLGGTKMSFIFAFLAASRTSAVLWQGAESRIRNASFKPRLAISGATILFLNIKSLIENSIFFS